MNMKIQNISRICLASEREVWNMINRRMKSREDCFKAMHFLQEHEFPNIKDPDSSIFDEWMHALSYRANHDFYLDVIHA